MIPILTKKRSSSPIDFLNIGILVVILGGVGIAVWQGWLAVQPGSLVSQVTVTATPSPSQASSVTLKLNKPHVRMGDEIKVDTNQIGRANPFVSP